MIQCIDLQLPSYQLYYKKYNYTGLLDPRSMARFTLMYLGVPATASHIDKMTRNEHVTRTVKDRLPFAKYLSHKKLPPSMRDTAVYDPPPTALGDSKVCIYLEVTVVKFFLAKTAINLALFVITFCAFLMKNRI